jgi:hypothetical protein
VEESSRPILKKSQNVERPTSHASKSLLFVEIEFASSLSTLTCDENTVCILQGNRSRLPILKAKKGELRFPLPVGLTHGRVLGMLKNPSYAGMYVFGRYQYRREISPEGELEDHRTPSEQKLDKRKPRLLPQILF